MRRREREVGRVRAIDDSTESSIRVRGWCAPESDRSPESRAEAFVRLNEGILRSFEIETEVIVRGAEAHVRLRPSTRIGAIPLRSPVSGTASLGLVVQPRFGWGSFGEVLEAVGLKCAPQPLDLPELPSSAGQIPRWVLSAIVLRRMRVLLAELTRKFELLDLDLPSPRGAIRWEEYASRRLSAGRWLEVPCRAPELSRDAELLGAIHFTVRQHRAALQALSGGATLVHALLAETEALLAQVSDVPSIRPSAGLLGAIVRRSFGESVRKALKEGLQAIQWTSDERGLAGLAELSGLPFHLDMERFFEAWAAMVAKRLARLRGGILTEQVPIALRWQPSWAGSARKLVPDAVVRTGDTVVVLDSKYKRHGEQILSGGWSTLSEPQREAHRADLHQVLAYASLYEAPRIVACLLYPCSPERIERLRANGAALRRAELASNRKGIEVVIAALPMSGDLQGAAGSLESLLRAA